PSVARRSGSTRTRASPRSGPLGPRRRRSGGWSQAGSTLRRRGPSRVPSRRRVEIRRAGVADLPAVTALVREAYAPYVPRIGREPAPMTADYAALLEAAEVWVATDGDRGVIGVLLLHTQTDSLFLENVAVAPAAQ